MSATKKKATKKKKAASNEKLNLEPLFAETSKEHRAREVLALLDRPMRMDELHLMYCTRCSITSTDNIRRTLDLLDNRGLVTRRRDPKDPRSNLWSLK